MKAAQHVEFEQPGHDLFDILRLVVVSRIHQYLGARPGGLGKQQGHAPVRDISVIEGRLEGLVLHQHALVACETLMGGLEPLFKPAAAVAHVLGAGVIGSVPEPE